MLSGKKRSRNNQTQQRYPRRGLLHKNVLRDDITFATLVMMLGYHTGAR